MYLRPAGGNPRLTGSIYGAGWFLTLNPKQKMDENWGYPYRKPPYFCNICFITSSCSNYCCPSDVSGRKLVFHRNQQSSQITKSVYRQSVPIYQFFPCIGVNPSGKKKNMFPQVMWKKNEMSPTLQLLSKIGNLDTNMLIIINHYNHSMHTSLPTIVGSN